MADLRPSIPDILSQALELPEADRPAFLAAACQGDDRVRLRVQQLLAADPQASDWLESPAITATIAADDTLGDLIGTHIGPYKLLEQIGEGGMGVVYVAEQVQPVRRRVALKIIKPGMDSKQVIARFEAERQALAMMDHPNIARILDAGTIGSLSPLAHAGPQPLTPDSCPLTPGSGRPYFVMELVRGIPITDFCEQQQLSVPERLQLMLDVCHAVQHAHQKGIIHRDLKPSNILVTMQDGKSVVKVIDFGVAKAVGQQLTDHSIYTAHLQLIGTPLYMSPEQAALSNIDVDTRSDVYSLGVLLYELLTGTTPFTKERLKSAGFDEMRRIIREEEPETVSTRLAKTRRGIGVPPAANRGAGVSPADCRIGVPPAVTSPTPRSALRVPRSSELDWIVARSLEKDRSRRYESPSSLAADLQCYLSGDLVQACPPSTAYRFRKFARKHKPALATSVLLAASLALGTGLSLSQAIRATAAEAQAIDNEARAKAEEQKALASASAERAAKEAEIRQRKQAEKNLEAALEAVDRMLANVNDDELNDVPRVGPLRRKMLKDAIAFYNRIPLQSGESPTIRFRVAKTWMDIAELSRILDEDQQALLAYETAIATLTQLVAELPDRKNYCATLAGFQRQAGWFYLGGTRDRNVAEKLFRRSSELYSNLASINPGEKSWLISQTHSLRGLTIALSNLGKQEEAIGTAQKGLDLLNLSGIATGSERAQMMCEMAKILANDSPAESDNLFRRAISEFRYNNAGHKSGGDRVGYAVMLADTARRVAARHPDEAEKWWDESISLWRKINGPTPHLRVYADLMVTALLMRARHNRRLAASTTADEDADLISSKVAQAETLFQEAITVQRQIVSRFGLRESRFHLVGFLQEEANYLLRQPRDSGEAKAEGSADHNLRADGLLTEAIQLCRALAAEFPENANYKSHLAALEKRQAQHFGQKGKWEAEKLPATKPEP